ncbi:hypothetical protein D9M71_677380 [compost metagenome]
MLLGKRTQVAITGHPDHLDALGLDRGRKGSDAQTGRVLGTVVLVDDENGEAEFHAGAPGGKAESDAYRGASVQLVKIRLMTDGASTRRGGGNGRIVGLFFLQSYGKSPEGMRERCQRAKSAEFRTGNGRRP